MNYLFDSSPELKIQGIPLTKTIEVSDCTIRLEDCYFRSNVDCTEFRIFSYTIFISRNDSVYFENQYHEDRRIDLTNLVGELDDIV